MPESSDRPPILGPDFFGLYERQVAELLSPSSPSSIPWEMNASKKPKRLFTDILEKSISEEKRESLKTLLSESRKTLRKEFDEIKNPVIRIRYILSRLRMKECGLAVQGSDGQESNERSSKRIKVCEICGSRPTKEEQCKGCHHDPKSSSAKEVIEADRKLRYLLEYPDSRLVEEKLKNQAEQFLALLMYDEKCLGNFLDTTVSCCRPMTHQEKRQLQFLVQKLPPKNFETAAKMISRGVDASKTSSHSAQVSGELYKLDKSKLWRLYFYVKTVERARNHSSK